MIMGLYLSFMESSKYTKSSPTFEKVPKLFN